MEFTPLATQEFTVSWGSSSDAKERVREAIEIVELVGSYVQLRRQGRNYVGLCPWHDDTRPSLQVNPQRQSFKCWVCDIGGDIFSFMMKMQGVSFPEALAMLADRAGIPLGPVRGPQSGGSSGKHDKRTLYQAMAWAEAQYHEFLLGSPEALPGRRYLQERGITPESIRRFHLGFSPNRRDWILHQAEGTKFDAGILETIGLLARPAGGGSPYDRFRGRVLFPIRNPQGQPLGLGGRILPELAPNTPAKYVNCPETPLFVKSKLLYGLDVAQASMRKSRTAVVMEGYTDCIVAHQHGFSDAVAVLGTALGENHIRTLRPFADRIVLVLDGDEAGRRRANEVLELFVAQQVDLRILTLPEGVDPCDFLQQQGAGAFGQLLAGGAVDALEHAFRSETAGVDLDHDVHGASRALERLVSIVAKAPRLRQDTTRQDRFREEKILQRLASSFRVPEEDVRRRLTALRRTRQRRGGRPAPGEPSAAEPGKRIPADQIDPWQRELLEILIQHPELVASARAEVRPEQLAPGPCREIFETCCRLSDAGAEPAFDRLMLEFDDAAMKSLLVELDENGLKKQERIKDSSTLLEQLVTSFLQRETKKQRPAQTATLRQGRLDESQGLDLLRRIVQQERARQGQTPHGYSGPTEG